jgi:hypothetical protein
MSVYAGCGRSGRGVVDRDALQPEGVRTLREVLEHHRRRRIIDAAVRLVVGGSGEPMAQRRRSCAGMDTLQ